MDLEGWRGLVLIAAAIGVLFALLYLADVIGLGGAAGVGVAVVLAWLWLGGGVIRRLERRRG